MTHWLNVRVKGSAMWPREEMTVEFGGQSLLLKPATRDTEQSLHIDLSRLEDTEALTLINRFLSVLSWCDQQPMENGYGWSGGCAPIAVGRDARTIGSSIAFPNRVDLHPDKRVRLALALYREGRTVNSISFAFLSYFKVLNIFWKDKYVDGKNDLVEGLRGLLPKLSEEWVVSRIEEIRASEPDVANFLYGSGRCAVAHAFWDPIVDPDDVSDLRRLSRDLEVVKAAAEYLIHRELGMSTSIFG